jgi:hypothetical protein
MAARPCADKRYRERLSAFEQIVGSAHILMRGFAPLTQGRSRMRAICTYGSVRVAP